MPQMAAVGRHLFNFLTAFVAWQAGNSPLPADLIRREIYAASLSCAASASIRSAGPDVICHCGVPCQSAQR